MHHIVAHKPSQVNFQRHNYWTLKADMLCYFMITTPTSWWLSFILLHKPFCVAPNATPRPRQCSCARASVHTPEPALWGLQDPGTHWKPETRTWSHRRDVTEPSLWGNQCLSWILRVLGWFIYQMLSHFTHFHLSTFKRHQCQIKYPIEM